MSTKKIEISGQYINNTKIEMKQHDNEQKFSITPRDFLNKVAERFNDEYVVLSEYKTTSKKIKIKHNTSGNESEIETINFLANMK